MKVKQLIEFLKNLDGEIDVYIESSGGEYSEGEIYSAELYRGAVVLFTLERLGNIKFNNVEGEDESL